MHLKLWDPKPSRGFNKETRDIDMYMRQDRARELWHGRVIQQCNEARELVFIDLNTRRKRVRW